VLPVPSGKLIEVSLYNASNPALWPGFSFLTNTKPQGLVMMAMASPYEKKR
jgi:hypothetical protein